ncbi:MAG: hypothetical protein AB7P97_20345 [Hyphomonadaceae bacterium]
MQLSGISEWLDELQDRAASFANKSQSYIINSLVRFRDDRGRLNFQLSKLRAAAPPVNAPQALRDQYNATLAELTEAKSRADFVGSIADQFTAITGLGALPLVVAGIPVAVLLAAIAALAIIVTNVSGQVTKYLGAKQIYDSSVAQGKDPTGALQSYYARQASTGFFGDVSQLVWPLAIVAGAYLFLGDKRRR